MYRTEDKDKAAGRWDVLSTREVFSAEPWVKIYVEEIRLPSGRIVDDYYRVGLPEYAMIYARREDGKVLFERQYKHGLREINLVLPTGSVEKNEQPLDAAKREFLEETGYEADKWSFVGTFSVDGNKGCGKGHFYIADDLKKVAEPVEDDMEDAEILFLEPEDAMQYISEASISELATPAFLAMATHPFFMKLRGIE